MSQGQRPASKIGDPREYELSTEESLPQYRSGSVWPGRRAGNQQGAGLLLEGPISATSRSKEDSDQDREEQMVVLVTLADPGLLHLSGVVRDSRRCGREGWVMSHYTADHREGEKGVRDFLC